MPSEYPVNWDALILLYQGTTRGFIVSKTQKMAIFQPKMALNSQNSQFFYIGPIWLCLMSIQLIGTRLFFSIKELRVDLLNKTLKMAIFQPKMAKKWPLMAKTHKFLHWSNMIMPYKYPVHWDALILLYPGTTSWFIEYNSKSAIFQQKMAQKWPVMAKIPNFLYWSKMIMPYEYPVNWDALILFY